MLKLYWDSVFPKTERGRNRKRPPEGGPFSACVAGTEERGSAHHRQGVGGDPSQAVVQQNAGDAVGKNPGDGEGTVHGAAGAVPCAAGVQAP